MGVSRTRTIKNKHAANKSGISGSKASKSGPVDGIVKSKKKGSAAPPKPTKGKSLAAMMNKKKKKVYTEKELGIPQLNMVTPIGVEKPKGKKKGKVFVDDRVSPLPTPGSRRGVVPSRTSLVWMIRARAVLRARPHIVRRRRA